MPRVACVVLWAGDRPAESGAVWKVTGVFAGRAPPGWHGRLPCCARTIPRKHAARPMLTCLNAWTGVLCRSRA